MQIQSTLQPQFSNETCFIIGSFSDGSFTPLGKTIDQKGNGELSRLTKDGLLPKEISESLYIPTLPNFTGQILCVNCGEKKTLSPRQFQKILNSIAKKIIQLKSHEIYFSLINGLSVDNKSEEWKTFHATITLGNAFYQFELNPKPLSTLESKHASSVKTLTFETKSDSVLQQSKSIIESINLVKNCANLPANICTPEFLAQTAIEIAKDFPNIQTTIIEKDELETRGFQTLLSVSKGSKYPPNLVCMEYKSLNPQNKNPVIFVGKGVTFDSGGISLKPGLGMDEMKYDMCGAATVIALIRTLSALKMNCHVIALAPCVENMPDNSASRPGDIVKSLSGKTVEILNTDAEGRLILSDTLTYAEKFSPECVIDLATLTGAVIMTFGNVAQAVMGNNQLLINEILEASEDSNERTWQLPLWEEYQEMLKSPFADLPNIHDEAHAKTIIAGCFLSRFTEKYPWAHLDIAGTAWLSGKEKGATGRPLILLISYLMNKYT